MKTVNVTNDNLVIQARNEADYAKALEVARKMVEIEPLFAVAATDTTEMWAQICASWDNKQAKDFIESYRMAKEAV